MNLDCATYSLQKWSYTREKREFAEKLTYNRIYSLAELNHKAEFFGKLMRELTGGFSCIMSMFFMVDYAGGPAGRTVGSRREAE